MCSANDVPAYDITDMTMDGAQNTANLPAICPTCQGRGSMNTDEGAVSCPSCKAKDLCGSCGYLTPVVEMERLNNGRYEWLRCFDCRDRDNARWAAQESEEGRWKDDVPHEATFDEWLDWAGVPR